MARGLEHEALKHETVFCDFELCSLFYSHSSSSFVVLLLAESHFSAHHNDKLLMLCFMPLPPGYSALTC